MGTLEAIKLIESNRQNLTWSQYSTLIGQAKAGDTDAAIKGLSKILKRNTGGKEMYAKRRTKLNEDSKKAVEREIMQEIGDQMDRLNRSIIIRLAYSLHTGRDRMGQKRLERAIGEFGEEIKKLTERYQIGKEDEEWLCVKKMEQDGLDVGKIIAAANLPVTWRVQR